MSNQNPRNKAKSNIKNTNSKDIDNLYESNERNSEEYENLITNETDDFKAKEENEVIKVPNCSYCNDGKTDVKYFLCLCATSPKAFEPICEACAIKCHKDHHPTLEVPGANVCYCGLSNHVISEEMTMMYKDKTENASKSGGLCFFSKFFKVVQSKGYYDYQGKNYCSVCLQYCIKNKINSEGGEVTFLGNDESFQCDCSESHEINIIKLNADLVSKKDFYLHMREINFNIIWKIPESRKIYIDNLNRALDDYLQTKSPDANFNFFSNIYMYKVLELFSMFSVFWENKYWYLIPKIFEKNISIPDLFSLFSMSGLFGKLKEDMVINFISAKFYFAELMFNKVIRTFMNKYCNLWNINCILNMDLYQRLIQIHQLEIFYYYTTNKIQQNYLNDLVQSVIELYDNILKINERFPAIFYQIISYVFPTFNRIIKYCTKYNMMTEENTHKYFELIYETLQIQKERKCGNLRDSSFYIVKSLLYTLLYKNDLICFDYLQGGDTYEKKGFMFSISEDSILFTKVILLVMDGFNRTESHIKTLKFDYFVRKIFELLLNNEDFYLNAVHNLEKWEIEAITKYSINEYSTINPENYNTVMNLLHSIIKTIDPDCWNFVKTFNSNLTEINRKYFEFDFEQEEYFTRINQILTDLNNFTTSKNLITDEISTYFACLQQSKNDISVINKLKHALFFSTFFQRIEEFLHIYTQSKQYLSEKEKASKHLYEEDLKENVEKLLKFLFILVIRDHKFLTLIMSLRPKIFATAFNDVFPTLENFLERIIEMLYTSSSVSSTGSKMGSSQDFFKSSKECGTSSLGGDNILGSKNLDMIDIEEYLEGNKNGNDLYKYDNYFFVSEVFCELINLNKKNLLILSDLMRLSKKLLKLITINNSEYLDIAETFIKTFIEIKNNKEIIKKIKNYFTSIDPNATEEDKKKVENKEEMDSFIYSYFDYMVELYQCDEHFFNYEKIKKCELFNSKKFEEIFNILLGNKFKGVPIEVEYSLCRYYLKIKNPLNINIFYINNQLLNLYMEDVEDNINILHLSRIPQEDKGIPKKDELLQIVSKLTEILMLFDEEKLKKLNENKIQKDFFFKYKYFENIIVRPLFNFFNLFIIDINKAKGKDVYVFYKAVFYFCKICIDFYQHKENYLINNYKNQEYKILGFNELIIRPGGEKSKYKEIYENVQKFTNTEKKEIFYFQIEEIFKTYINTLKYIICPDKEKDFTIISNTSYNSETKYLATLEKMNEYLQKKEELINIYTDFKQKNYDDNLSLIHSYKVVKEELEYDAAIPLINYLILKLFDQLTYANIEQLQQKDLRDNLQKNLDEDISKPQNGYALIYLNCFFYNDSEDFQNAFSSPEIIIPKNFYNFLTTNIIVSNVLNEVKKLYDLDYLEQNQSEPRYMGRTESLSFSIGKYAIKFVQNLCEGHNREYQDKFFDMELDPNIYLRNNKNVYEETGSGRYIGTVTNRTFGGEPIEEKIEEDESKENKSEDSSERISEKSNSSGEKISKDDKRGKGGDKGEGGEEEDEIITSGNKNKIGTISKKSDDYNSNNKQSFVPPIKKTIASTTKIVTSMDSGGIEDAEAEEKEILLANLQVSFFNLICYLMEIINHNLHVGQTLKSKLFSSISKYKNYENIDELYTRLSDLIVEMVQGTDPSNFKKFYQGNLPPEFKYFTEDGAFITDQPHKIFIFLELAHQVKDILFKKNLAFNRKSYNMIFDLFITINNLLSQEKVDQSIIRGFTSLFPPEELLSIISLYLRGIYLSHYCQINYHSDDFIKRLKYLELNESQLFELKSYFKENPHIFHDDYFQLASQMFLFLTILAEKYNVNEAEKIKKYAKKKPTESRITNTKEVEINNEDENYITERSGNTSIRRTTFFTVGDRKVKLKQVKPNEHNYVNDKIVTVQFFKKVIKKCEFKVDNGDELQLKIIYFICDPHYYYISKSNKENFFKDVDRSSATIKLKSLLEVLNAFYSEIEYKKEVYRKSKYILYFLGMNFKMVDFSNFCISLLINTILVLFLKDEKDEQSAMVLFIIKIFVTLQILMNIVFLFIFYISKYGFYVLLEKNKLGKDHKLSLMEKINLYFLDSFLFNDEIYLMILIIIMGICGVATKYGAFLFALQLLSIIKFIDTIKEILLAFKIRFTQLLAIIAFLAILIYFYAGIGFYFLIDEFNMPDNPRENFCQTLFECTVNYFNHGVRSGGGIGDLLPEKDYTSEKGLYFLRFFNDLIFYITVILLLLNMINGVIVTTFSQIREESNKKEEDQQNRCYICNIDRVEFQKNKIDFGDHQKNEHNINNYIKFFVYLSHINEKDMDADQGFINNCIKENDIKFFPVNCAMSIGEVESREGKGD